VPNAVGHFQYRIKHLLILVVVAAMAATLVASSVGRMRRSDVYTNAGRQGWYVGPCGLVFSNLPLSDRRVLFNTRFSPITAEKVQALHGFRSFSSIDCFKAKIDRPAFAMLVALPTEHLSVADTNVDDLMMSDLPECRLKYLNLSGTLISDAGLDHLKSNQTIEYLSVESTNLSDESVDTIISMSNLRELNIGHTNITNAGLCRILESGSGKSVVGHGLRYAEDALNVASRQGVELIYADRKTNRGVKLVIDENGNKEFKVVDRK